MMHIIYADSACIVAMIPAISAFSLFYIEGTCGHSLIAHTALRGSNITQAVCRRHDTSSPKDYTTSIERDILRWRYAHIISTPAGASLGEMTSSFL